MQHLRIFALVLPAARYQMLVLAFLLQTMGLQAQDSVNSHLILGARFNYGMVLRHSQAMAKDLKTNPLGYQLDAAFHYKSKNARDYCNCYPKLGLSFYYWDYSQPEILGHGMTLLAFAEPFFNAHNRVAFSLRAGLGMNYQDKPYDSVNNPLNIAYSTRFAFAALISLTANIRLSDHLKLILAVNYNHMSNGGVKLPNKGLNYPSFSAGLDYSFRKSHFARIRDLGDNKERFQRRWRRELGLYLGFRGITDDEKLYYVYGFYGQLARQLSHKLALPVGLDFAHDKAELARSDIYPSITYRAANKLSLYTGFDYLLGKLTLSFNLGGYLYSPDRISVWLYQRYIVRVNVYKFIVTGLSLKAHGHIAEYFDLRIGASF